MLVRPAWACCTGNTLLEELAPFIVGGDTVNDSTYESAKFLPPPEKFEAGLQNYAGIIGSGAAVDYIEKVGRQNIEKHERETEQDNHGRDQGYTGT